MFRCRYLFTFLIFFVLVGLSVNTVSAAQVEAPKIDQAHTRFEQNTEISLSGTCFGDVGVMIYIDGVFSGWANTKIIEDNTQHFYFVLGYFLSTGKHEVYAISQDKTSLLLSSPVVWAFEVVADLELSTVPTPTILLPDNVFLMSNESLSILGLSRSNTRVLLRLDDVNIFYSDILSHESGTANFHFQLTGQDVGKHILEVNAFDDSRVTSITKTIFINVEPKLPAPTLIGYDKGVLTGLTKNNTSVAIFIDGVYFKDAEVTNDDSGTASFYANIDRGLAENKIYVIAIDRRGKISEQSKLPKKSVIQIVQLKPMISEEAASEESVVKSGLTADDEEADKNDEVKVLGEESDEENEKTVSVDADNREIAGLLDDLKKEVRGDSGAVDESRKQQGRLQLNILIFILFLFGVIVWIFWVNRELIKERKELNELEEKSNKN